MTLESTLQEKLSEWQPAPGRQNLQVAADGWTATLTADRSDVLGCLLWELHLRRDGTAEVDVKQWAEVTAQRVAGLMETLKVVEIDTTRNQAQLRSTSPSQRGEKRFYYEVMLSALGHAVLRRFQTNNGETGREQVAFAVTHETLARLASDVAAAC